MSSNLVYAIQAVRGGPVKIGVSANPSQRLAQLQSAHHEDLQLVRSFDGRTTSSSELRLHSKLASARLRGEWFNDVPEVWDELDAEEFAARSEEISIKTANAIGVAAEKAVEEALANAALDSGPTLEDVVLAFHAAAETAYDELLGLFTAAHDLADEMVERGVQAVAA